MATINGDSNNNTLSGGNDPDMIYAGGGSDSVSAGGGSDTVYAGSGNDSVSGGNGADSIFGEDGSDTLKGDAGNDTIYGGNDFDMIFAGSGNDSLYGDAGTDQIFGGSGDDKAYGGSENDSLMGMSGNDTLDGGDGEDFVSGGSGSDLIYGGAGNDSLRGDLFIISSFAAFAATSGTQAAASIANASGMAVDVYRIDSAGNPQFVGTLPAGATWAGTANTGETYVLTVTGTMDVLDILPVAEGASYTFNPQFNDTIEGGDGADTIRGEFGDDQIYGGLGNDSLFGGVGNDTVFGGAGNDYVELGDGNDSFGNFNDEGGDDTVYGGGGNDFIISGGENDVIYGGTGNDTLSAGIGIDSMYGGDGSDVFLITDDHQYDYVDGGDGSDVIYTGNYLTQQGVVVAYSDTGAGTYDFVGSDGYGNFLSVEGVAGTDYADTLDAGADRGGVTLHGNDGADVIIGGSGNDTLSGGAGADSVQGGAGQDVLFGDAGNDTLFGGADDDMLDGGAGNDLLYGGDGNDLFSFSNDYGNDTLFGGAGYDVLDQSGLTTTGSVTFYDIEEIRASNVGESWQWSNSQSGINFYGGAGQDSVVAGSGNDLLSGGGGNDHLSAGAGNDTLVGGAGDDVLTTGEGADRVVLQTAGGTDRVSDFDMTRFDGKTVDQLDVSDLTNASGGPVTWRDVTVTDTNGDGTGDAVLTFPNGESVVMEGVSPEQASGKQNMAAMGIPCFTAGTPILTPDGWRAVESLGAGDWVLTHDGVPLQVLWAGRREVSADSLRERPRMRPVRIAKGTLGNRSALLVSPQHAVLMQLDGHEEVLVRAVHLAAFAHGGFRVAKGVGRVAYHHLLLPRHAILNAADALLESFYPGRCALSSLSRSAQIEVAATILAQHGCAQMPPLGFSFLGLLYGPRVRRVLTGAEVAEAVKMRRLDAPSGQAGFGSNAA